MSHPRIPPRSAWFFWSYSTAPQNFCCEVDGCIVNLGTGPITRRDRRVIGAVASGEWRHLARRWRTILDRIVERGIPVESRVLGSSNKHWRYPTDFKRVLNCKDAITLCEKIADEWLKWGVA